MENFIEIIYMSRVKLCKNNWSQIRSFENITFLEHSLNLSEYTAVFDSIYQNIIGMITLIICLFILLIKKKIFIPFIQILTILIFS